jgi:hypothetical protein
MPESDSYAGPNSRLLAAGPHSHETSGGRFGNALSVSVVAHAVGGLSILLLMIPSRISFKTFHTSRGSRAAPKGAVIRRGIQRDSFKAPARTLLQSLPNRGLASSNSRARHHRMCSTCLSSR